MQIAIPMQHTEHLPGVQFQSFSLLSLHQILFSSLSRGHLGSFVKQKVKTIIMKHKLTEILSEQNTHTKKSFLYPSFKYPLTNVLTCTCSISEYMYVYLPLEGRLLV